MTNRGTALWQTRQNFLFVCLPIGKNPNKNFNDDMTNRGIFPICHWTGTTKIQGFVFFRFVCPDVRARVSQGGVSPATLSCPIYL